MIKRVLTAFTLGLGLTAAASAFAEVDAERLQAALEDPIRAEDSARDQYRHPGETLAFLGIRPDMTVVEMAPGGGWYTRILAPYLEDEGHYVAGNYHPDTFGERAVDALTRWPETWPDQVRAWAPEIGDITTFTYQTEEPEAFGPNADAALYFRAVHGLASRGRLTEVLGETYAMLKPGGLVGVVQHRAPADATDEYANGANGYMKQADVIALFEDAGFEFIEASDVNANPKDPANWETGVWTLPPSLRGPEELRDEVLAIGESDRMTLKFRKPATD